MSITGYNVPARPTKGQHHEQKMDGVSASHPPKGQHHEHQQDSFAASHTPKGQHHKRQGDGVSANHPPRASSMRIRASIRGWAFQQTTHQGPASRASGGWRFSKPPTRGPVSRASAGRRFSPPNEHQRATISADPSNEHQLATISAGHQPKGQDHRIRQKAFRSAISIRGMAFQRASIMSIRGGSISAGHPPKSLRATAFQQAIQGPSSAGSLLMLMMLAIWRVACSNDGSLMLAIVFNPRLSG